LAAAEGGVNPLHGSGGGASEEGRHQCAASGQAGFTPTLCQASATAFCSVLVAPYRCLPLATVRPAKTANASVRLEIT
jgi:hypothetical protein